MNRRNFLKNTGPLSDWQLPAVYYLHVSRELLQERKLCPLPVI
jgi:hypothetical protein